jgi:hypothetical protein
VPFVACLELERHRRLLAATFVLIAEQGGGWPSRSLAQTPPLGLGFGVGK